MRSLYYKNKCGERRKEVQVCTLAHNIFYSVKKNNSKESQKEWWQEGERYRRQAVGEKPRKSGIFFGIQYIKYI